VVRSTVTESTALGAALLAGLAVGVWKSPADFETNWQVDQTFEPSRRKSEIRALRAGWNEALERTRLQAGS